MFPIYVFALNSTEEKRKLTVLYERHKRRLMSIALSITRNKAMAEDAVHNVFIAAIHHKDKILSMDEIDFLKWSVIVVKGKCIDLQRKDKYYAGSPIDDLSEVLPDDSIPVDEYVAQQDIYGQLKQHIAGLDDISRQILEMKYVLDMSMKEIADELGFTTTQVNSRIARARAKVRTRMGNEVINHA